MTQPVPELTPEAAVKELAKLVRDHVEDLMVRHHMINLLSCVSGSLFVLRSDLSEFKDLAMELAENAAQ